MVQNAIRHLVSSVAESPQNSSISLFFISENFDFLFTLLSFVLQLKSLEMSGLYSMIIVVCPKIR